MNLYEQLKGNKGLVSTALSKKLAKEALGGKTDIIAESVNLLKVSEPNVRAAAAKILEIVAESKPEFVSPHLEEIVPCLSLPESQTRWVSIYILGCCASQNPLIAEKGLNKAIQFIEDPDSGTCLVDRSITYLGLYGSVSSKKNAKIVLSALMESAQLAPGRAIRSIEGIDKMLAKIGPDSISEVINFLNGFLSDKRANVLKKANATLRKILAIKKSCNEKSEI